MSTVTVVATLPARPLGTWRATKVIAEGTNGSFCLKPRHIDYVSVLAAGIVIITLEDGSETFMATDSGVLVKRGREVFVSVRRAAISDDLEDLRATVRDVFRQRDAQERRVRAAAFKLEVSFVRRFMQLTETFRGR